jgi:ATP-dependent Clp protease ATP-binding subunit ClpA
MIGSVQKRLKGINLIVELSVQAFLTDYDPLYGARPLRRAIMKYLEDTLAACLSKPYILIRRFMFVERK